VTVRPADEFDWGQFADDGPFRCECDAHDSEAHAAWCARDAGRPFVWGHARYRFAHAWLNLRGVRAVFAALLAPAHADTTIDRVAVARHEIDRTLPPARWYDIDALPIVPAAPPQFLTVIP
jgi:hypothetical protein